jgi:hypothetical protein
VASSQIGLEIDGDRVTLVEVTGGVAVSSRTVTHPNVASALALALAGYKIKRTDPAIRLVLSCQGVNLRRIDVTASMLERRAFEDAAFTAMPVPRETNSVAGIFFDPQSLTGDLLTPGIAVIAPSQQVEKVYEALGRRESEVVAPPCVLSGLDGVWLGLRHRTADVTLVANGRPVAYRQLRSGGLDAISGALGDDGAGTQRLYASLNRTGMVDQIAEAEIARYLQNVAVELRQTVDYWARSGEDVSGPVAVYGPGANASGIAAAMAEQRFEVGMHPEIERRLVYLPAAERGAAVAGFLAAVTAGTDMPQAAFVNPYAIAHEEDNRRRDRRARRVLAGVVAAGFIGLVAGIPYVGARLDLNDAKADLASATVEFEGASAAYQKLADTEDRLGYIDAFRAAEPAWPSALSVTFSTMPVGAKIRELNTTLIAGELRVRASAELPGGSYADLTKWLEKLRATANVSAAWSESFSNREGRAIFDVTFTIPPVSAVDGETTAPIPAATEEAPSTTADAASVPPTDQTPTTSAATGQQPRTETGEGATR